MPWWRLEYASQNVGSGFLLFSYVGLTENYWLKDFANREYTFDKLSL